MLIAHKREETATPTARVAHDHDARQSHALIPCGTTSPPSSPAHLPRRSANNPSDAPAPFEHQCAASCWHDSHAQAAKSPARRPPFHDLLSGTARLHRRGEGAPRRRGDGGRDTCRTRSLASPAATAQRGFGSGAGSSARQGGGTRLPAPISILPLLRIWGATRGTRREGQDASRTRSSASRSILLPTAQRRFLGFGGATWGGLRGCQQTLR